MGFTSINSRLKTFSSDFLLRLIVNKKLFQDQHWGTTRRLLVPVLFILYLPNALIADAKSRERETEGKENHPNLVI